jgi:hypothetical protein
MAMKPHFRSWGHGLALETILKGVGSKGELGMKRSNLGNIINQQFRIVFLFIALTGIVWFVTGLMAANVFAPDMVPIVLFGTILLSLLILSLILCSSIYYRIKKIKPGREFVDERSDMCSFKATRNAFIVTLVFLALYMIIGQMSPSSLYRIQALQGVFGVSVAAYTASFYYYLYANQLWEYIGTVR